MNLFRSPVIAVAIATALASTTGYCVLQKGYPPVPAPPAEQPAPTRLLPDAIIPYPLANGE